MTSLFNRNDIASVQAVQRDLNKNKGSLDSVPDVFKTTIKHSGNLVTMKTGEQFLVHKGSGPTFEGKAGNPSVITPAKYMSDKWTNVGEKNTPKNKTLGDMVNNGPYNLATKNCNHATAKNNTNVKTPIIPYEVVPTAGGRDKSSKP